MAKVVHITTVHRRKDVRIFRKECVSLAKAGYDVSLVVADGLGNETDNGVRIIDAGKAEGNRIKRMIFTSKNAVRVAESLKADVYHFHDPDLLLDALRLKRGGAKVVFDSHEDFPALMLQRDYIPKPLRKMLFFLAKQMERYASRRLSGVVCVTENIRDKFLSYGKIDTEVVKNFPIVPQGLTQKPNYNPQTLTACYAGGLTAVRGVREMIVACAKAGLKLILAGEFDDRNFYETMKALSEWSNVEYLGFVPNEQITKRVYARASVGLVLLHQAPNHVYSIPVKQLEYMQAGLPIVASREVLFCKQVIQEETCGLVVDPLDTDAVAETIRNIIDNPEQAKQMSENAFRAYSDKYNWSNEEKRLLDFYCEILG